MNEIWYRLTKIPDLTLNKYASLVEKGVDGVITQHTAFLRQLNRKGIVSGISFHLFYLYVAPKDKPNALTGHRLQIYFLIRGNEISLENVRELIGASPLADFYTFEDTFKPESDKSGEKKECSIANVLEDMKLEYPHFGTCAFMSKHETMLPSVFEENEDYYLIRESEMNDEGRLFNMFKMMQNLNRSALYRVDLYPVERADALREALRRPMSVLRRRQDERGSGKRDYEGRDVLKSYEDMLEMYDTSPHFIMNVMAFAESKDSAVLILDAAGSESMIRGRYNVSTYTSDFTPMSFLDGETVDLENPREGMVVRKGNPGLIICKKSTADMNLNYLPTLFSLEEAAPYFRLPALYDGETIQIAKETAPAFVPESGSLMLGKDSNGYDVRVPIKLLPKHAFIAGVPGSGKTNTMLHITSSLWNLTPRIPFLVLEPAKQEYRALLNTPEMKGTYLFSPNADMSFPLHINPFDMPEGTLISEHIRRLCAVFEGAFPLEPPMPFLLDTAIEAVYKDAGWMPDDTYRRNNSKDGKVRFLPTMSKLYKRLEEELDSTKYSDEVRGNLESALKVRIGSLLRREMGDVFDVPVSTFPPERWLEIPAIVELESMGTGPANFLTLMLCSLIREVLKINPVYNDGPVRHVIFIEEAHNLIGTQAEEKTGVDADPKQAATAFIVKMLAEVRALKEGIFIADQLPSAMAQEVLKNTGMKIAMKITASDDRALIGSTMAANQCQLEEMSTFLIGEALIFYEKLMRPFKMRLKEWCGEVKDEKKKDELKNPKNDEDLRRDLADNEEYRTINTISVLIMCRKCLDMTVSLNGCLNFANEAYSIAAKCNRSAKLAAMEGGFTEEQQKKYDESIEVLDFYCTDYNEQVKRYNVITASHKAVSTLDRLKNGRWKRCYVPEPLLMRVNEIINDVGLKALTLMDIVTKIMDNNCLEKEKEEFVERTKKYNDDLRAFVESATTELSLFYSKNGKNALNEYMEELMKGEYIWQALN